MRRSYGSAVAIAAIALVPHIAVSQQMELSRKVAEGGIAIPGWMGKIDANEEKNGQVLNNSKLAKDGNDLHVTTGPAVAYWNPSNTASGGRFNLTITSVVVTASFLPARM